MKSFVFVAALLTLTCGARPVQAQDTPAAEPECAFREDALPAPAAAPNKAAMLTLLKVDPPEGGDVRSSTVLGVDVEYHLAKFAPGRFVVMALFPKVSMGAMTPGTRADLHYLTGAHGKVHLCVPLKEMYDSESTRWPLTMVVGIHEETDAEGSSRVLANTRSIKFNALDIPEGALARQAEAPPDEYRDALMTVFGYLERQAALYKVCIQHYPDIQAVYTKAYRRWETRHADDIAFVNERQFESVKLSVGNNAQVAARVFDVTREANIKIYERMPGKERRSQCEYALSDFQEPKDLTQDAIGDELDVLRKWHSSRPKPATAQ